MVRFSRVISAIDTHTAGEPTRIVLSGLPHLPGGTMAEKKRYLKEHLDHFRTLLMREPRGHRDMFGAVLTPPTSDRSDRGILFMDHAGYLDMCGHGVIAVTSVLIELGMMVKDAVNPQRKVQHPTRPDIERVELTEIYDRPDPAAPFSRSLVIFGRGQLDRCPCGTGISATMATLHDRGELPLGVEFVDEGIIGTRFRGKLAREVQVGGFRAVRPILIGAAYVTGIQQFVVDPNDPLKYGFVLGR